MPSHLRVVPTVKSEPDGTGGESIDRTTAKVSEQFDNVKLSGDTITPTEELYPADSGYNPVLSTAFDLLRESISFLDESIDRLKENDLIKSDDSLQQFQAIIPELFCCRNLGDGFGAIVISIYHSLKNNEGLPLKQNQLKIIRKIINRLCTEPYISFDDAVEEISELEEANLLVQPDHFKYVADLLND